MLLHEAFMLDGVARNMGCVLPSAYSLTSRYCSSTKHWCCTRTIACNCYQLKLQLLNLELSVENKINAKLP